MSNKENKKYITNYEIYNKLESIEKKLDNEKSKGVSNFVVTFLMSSGLALFIVGLTILIQLFKELGGSMWIFGICYIVFGISLLKIGINAHSRIAEK